MVCETAKDYLCAPRSGEFVIRLNKGIRVLHQGNNLQQIHQFL